MKVVVRLLGNHFWIYLVMGSRNWCFTLNNPTDSEYPESWNRDQTKLIVYQTEIGENGTYHLQGYLELRSPRRISYLKSLNARCHWEIRMGSRRQALEYVTKEDTRLAPPKGWTSNMEPISTEEGATFYELLDGESTSFWTSLGLMGTMSREEKKSSAKLELSQIQSQLQEGSSIEEIADEHFDLWVKYYRAFEKYALLKTPSRNWPVDVHVVIGPTGTGKSKWAMDTYPSAYWKQRSKWWDGYFNHTEVVLDEYYGWLPFDLLLRLLDRYPLLVESKGGQLQFVAKSIVITSNKPPHDWYDSNCYFASLARRFNKLHFIPAVGIHAVYDTYAEFKNAWNQHLINRVSI
jgi:hypothetical protein